MIIVCCFPDKLTRGPEGQTFVSKMNLVHSHNHPHKEFVFFARTLVKFLGSMLQNFEWFANIRFLAKFFVTETKV